MLETLPLSNVSNKHRTYRRDLISSLGKTRREILKRRYQTGWQSAAHYLLSVLDWDTRSRACYDSFTEDSSFVGTAGTSLLPSSHLSALLFPLAKHTWRSSLLWQGPIIQKLPKSITRENLLAWSFSLVQRVIFDEGFLQQFCRIATVHKEKLFAVT